ncbi:fatty acid oxidation complex subunit alpha FadB, partial [Acinetobacter baumannii]|nr:fatty acid oxidation complex subunit alpha FadB [Acinetobacter baumannii]
SVRLSRHIGIDNAVEWMAMATPKKPAAALKDGAVDAVVAADKLLDAATDLVKQAISGRLNWKAKRQEKQEAAKQNRQEQKKANNTARG